MYWISEYWNIVDLSTLVVFSIGVSLRFNQETLDAARIILAIDLVIFYVRVLQIFSIHKNLGPKLIMIQRMVCGSVTEELLHKPRASSSAHI